MAGTYVKNTLGVWRQATTGASGIGTAAYVKVNGVWEPGFGAGGILGPTMYVKIGGVWKFEVNTNAP